MNINVTKLRRDMVIVAELRQMQKELDTCIRGGAKRKEIHSLRETINEKMKELLGKDKIDYHTMELRALARYKEFKNP